MQRIPASALWTEAIKLFYRFEESAHDHAVFLLPLMWVSRYNGSGRQGTPLEKMPSSVKSVKNHQNLPYIGFAFWLTKSVKKLNLG